MTEDPLLKPLVWVGSSRKEFRTFPDEVKAEMGYALFVAQAGGRHRKVKIFKGMGDAGVLEIVEDHRGDTFRAIYTVRFELAVYVLHAFQKKSKKGIKTPKAEIQMIEQRLRDAEHLFKDIER